METRSKRRRLLQSYVSSQWPDLPAIFESLNDDTLTTVFEFVGDKSYRSFGGVNKRCKEVYLATKGMTKETFLFGYGPLSAIKDRIERVGHNDYRKFLKAVGKGVVYHNRRDVMDWALEERNNLTLKGICTIAAMEERFDILVEVFNGVGDWNDKGDVFKGSADVYAALCGKLNVLKWLETYQLDISGVFCAQAAAHEGHIHILKWLREVKGLELDGELYNYAIRNGHLHVMKWLREEEVPWVRSNFPYAAKRGNIDILQWIHDEGCPWHDLTFGVAAKRGNLAILQWLHDKGYPWYRGLPVDEENLKPEVLDWLRVNGYVN